MLYIIYIEVVATVPTIDLELLWVILNRAKELTFRNALSEDVFDLASPCLSFSILRWHVSSGVLLSGHQHIQFG